MRTSTLSLLFLLIACHEPHDTDEISGSTQAQETDTSTQGQDTMAATTGGPSISDCSVGSEECKCTSGLGCDPGLVCIQNICVCPIGSEGCPCTVGESCDPGLACFDETCLDEDNPTTGTSSGEDTSETPDDSDVTDSSTDTDPNACSRSDLALFRSCWDIEWGKVFGSSDPTHVYSCDNQQLIGCYKEDDWCVREDCYTECGDIRASIELQCADEFPACDEFHYKTIGQQLCAAVSSRVRAECRAEFMCDTGIADTTGVCNVESDLIYNECLADIPD